MDETTKGQSDRDKCISPHCVNEILPATAKANSGLCGPCLAKRRQEERAKYIQENRRDVNPFVNLSDPVEIIRTIHIQRPNDPLIRYLPPPRPFDEFYRELNERDAGRLIDIAVEASHRGDDDFAQAIAKSLACLTDYSLDQLLETWIAKNKYWPAVIFRGAGPTIRDAIIKSLEDGKANANHALSALAWVGDVVVQQAFRRWDSSPQLRWRKGLFIPPSGYASVAGWELTNGGRRELFHSHCLAMTPTSPVNTDAAVQAMREAADNCPWCSRKLVTLIEVDLTDQRFAFLKANVPTLPVLTCDACTCFGIVYARIDARGNATWAHENQRPKHLPNDLGDWLASPWRGVPISLRERKAMEAADWCMELNHSQIGGLPSWVQDPAYPPCPSCKTTMTFIGEVDNEAFPGHEGIFYAFLCRKCRITATTYQQS